MDAGIGLQLLILIVLIYLSSFFSAAETAMMSVSRLRLRSLSDDGNGRAKLALNLLENHQQKMLTAILIGNNIVNLSASALTGVMANRFGGNMAVTLATAGITLVIVVFGEVTPKTVATVRAEKLALRNAPILSVLMTVLTPLIILTNAMSRGILFLKRVDLSERTNQPTEEDIRTMVEVSHEDGQIENDEKEMINNVFDLTDSEARDIMVPRVDVVCADVTMKYSELIRLFSGEKYTRLPVYEDNPDNIIGVLNMKDILLYDHEKPFNIRDYVREAYFTHEFKNTYELFLEMRKASVTMSIVLDEYGVMVGIITMEDILEEIVGEIRDEYDQSELNEIRKIGPGDYICEASLSIDDFDDQVGADLESEDYDSLGGYLIGLLDHIPEKGEFAVDHEGNKIRAIEVENNRIEKVRITLKDHSKKEEQDSVSGQTDGNNNDKDKDKDRDKEKGTATAET